MAIFFDYEDFYRIRQLLWNPQRPHLGYFKDPETCTRFHWAFVVEIGKGVSAGLVKLHFPQWGPNVVSDFVPVVRPYGGTEQGIFVMPQVGDFVVCVFINDNPSRPLVLGTLYSAVKKPVIELPDNDHKNNNQKYIRTPSGLTMIMNDDENNLRIEIYMNEGKMRFIFDSNEGITIVNDENDGEIYVECQEILIEGEDIGVFEFAKGCTITAEEITIESKKGIILKSAKDIVLKGSKIKMKGNACTAANKQIAVKGDTVVGIDTHIEMVPAGPSLVPTPIPNPYVGKIESKVSTDVLLKDKGVAVKGSKSKAIGPGHVIIPPGTQFQKNPSNEGEITLGTVPTVKVNGQDVAVLGCMVKTCNDPMDTETCQVIAAGATVSIPIQIPGLESPLVVNMREPIAKEAPIKNRSLENPKWSKTKANIGETVKLSVQCPGQYSNANVRFSIYPEGADTKVDPPVSFVGGQNTGGKAEAEWEFEIGDVKFENTPDDSIIEFYRERLGVEPDPEKLKYYIQDYEEAFDNPVTKTTKLFFTAKSFGCKEVKSGNIEIGSDIKIEFYDENGNPLKDVEYSIMLPDGKTIDGTTSDDGKVTKTTQIPGRFQLKYKEKDN